MNFKMLKTLGCMRNLLRLTNNFGEITHTHRKKNTFEVVHPHLDCLILFTD